MRTRLESEVLDQLRTSGWMSALEIRNRIGAKRNAALGPHPFGKFISLFSPTWGEILSDRSPSFAALYICLETLEEDGSASSRARDDPPEVVARRGGRRGREWTAQ